MGWKERTTTVGSPLTAHEGQETDPPSHGPGSSRPMLCKLSFLAMDTSRLLLAFLAFGAACTTLWAWMLATSSSTQEG